MDSRLFLPLRSTLISMLTSLFIWFLFVEGLKKLGLVKSK